MTNEEAIKILEVDKAYLYPDNRVYNRRAYDMAIKALKNERPQGEWIDNGQGFHFCKSCGYFALYQTHDTKTYFEKLSDCCPHCGAKMKEV